MRIALTVDPELPVPPKFYGGIERIVDMLARSLGERGHPVTLFANGESKCPVPLVPWPGRTSRSPLDTARNAALLSRHAMAGQYDLVHSFSRLAYLAPFMPLGIPKLMSYHREISWRTTALAHRLSRGTLEFTAISRQMMRRSGAMGRWHLVPNGVPLDTYEFRHDFESDAPLVFLGRIEEIKGPHLAIEVARRTKLPLVIAGNIPAEHQAWFDVMIAPRIDGAHVRYAGVVDDRQKNQLLGRARALLMPILWEEPFGMVMAEAMACGTPVIGLRRGAVPEVVEDAVTGFVRDDVDGLVDAVARIGEIDRGACRKRVEVFFSDEAMVDGYVAVYRKMLEPKGAARDQR